MTATAAAGVAVSRGSGPEPVRGYDDVRVERHGDRYLASRPSVGALSVLTPYELIGFHLFLANTSDTTGIVRLFRGLGFDDETAARMAQRLEVQLERDGWLREAPPSPDDQRRLQQVYFTITRECDLACLYCYQGLRKRSKKMMPLDDARKTLEKISAFNPKCHIAVTGGEPFTHPDVFAILDYIEDLAFPFGVLCNGSFVTDVVAGRLASYRHLVRFQISLDGLTEETHALTRGRQSHAKSMAAIDHAIHHDLPLILAPTIHEGNAHEIGDMAVFAARKGAWFSPNNLRTFPHDENKGKFELDNATLQRVISECYRRLAAEFSPDYLRAIEGHVKGPNVCSVDAPNAKFICGTAHSLLDIDWNGEVYPCHLLKDRSLILGNIFNQSFDDVFGAARDLRIRVPSYEIPKCGGCKFSSRCGGGCRAGAFYAYGSLAREDDLCDLNYASHLQRVLCDD